MQYFGKTENGQDNFGMTDNFGSRLREERVRINPKQGDFAAVLGVRQSQLSDWERGGTGLKIEHLALLGGAGIDVQYVVTGQRGGQLLAPRESAVLDAFRRLDETAQDAVLIVMRHMTHNTHE